MAWNAWAWERLLAERREREDAGLVDWGDVA